MTVPAPLQMVFLLGALQLSAGLQAATTAADGPAVGKPPPVDIIVTARRRPEALQRTPVSVIALTVVQLEARSATNLRDLQKFVPNLTLAPSQNVGDAAGNVFIRGIGQEDFTAGTEPGVALYLDGIYLGRTMGTLLDLVDVDRVEVLRGPQGTLYGRNAIGGAINVISAAPEAETRRSFDLIAGGFDRIETRAMLNVPLGHRLLLRVAAARAVRDGYLRRQAAPFAPTAYTQIDLRREGADNRVSGRLQLRWLADDGFRVDLAVDGQRRRGTQAATHLDAIDPGAMGSNLSTINRLVRLGTLPAPEITNALVSDNLLTSFASGGNRIDQDTAGISVSAVKTLGRHELRLTGAYRRLRSDVASDADGTWFNMFSGEFDERQKQASLELQAGGQFSGVAYTAGAIVYRERAELLPVAGVGQDVLYFCKCLYTLQTQPRTLFPQRIVATTSFGAYAQASVPLSPNLAATLGARYSLDRKAVDALLVVLDPITLVPMDRIAATGGNRGHWASFTWRLGLELQATRELLAYLSVGKGFKSGGFNVRPALNLPNLGLSGYRPEIALAYEAGFRSQWFGDRLRLNATVFQTEYRDIQLRQQTFFSGIVTTLVENAARARVRGVEIEGVARPLPDLAISLSFGHLAPRYRDVGTVPGLTLQTAFQRTPRDSFVAGLDYAIPLGSGRFDLHGDFSYRSREQFQLVASPWDQRAYGHLGARLSWRAAGNGWSIALFGTNLADKRYRVAGRATLLNQTGFAHSIIGPPREIGVQWKIAY